MARSVNLTAELIPRASDVAIPDLLLPKIPPFSELKSTAKLANFPGAVILRRFRKGEVICRQGEPGWTAFYIPTSAELAAIRESPAIQSTAARAELAKAEAKVADLAKQLAEAAADPKKSDSLKGKLEEALAQVAELKERIAVLQAAVPVLEASITDRGAQERSALVAAGESALAQLRGRVAAAEARDDSNSAAAIRTLLGADAATKRARAQALKDKDPELAGWLGAVAQSEEARKVASVHLAIPLPRSNAPGGILGRLKAVVAPPSRAKSRHPLFIPIDGPRDLDYETREGLLNEGELFGEMSCLYRSPRSATVTAARDCYMLEMLRNVLEAMNRDAGFKSRLDSVYRERVLRLQLRNLPILLELDARQLERLSQSAELIEIPSGGILYDENEQSDGMHLIRSGIVKVMLNVSYLLGEADVTDRPALVAELAAGKAAGAGPLHRLLSLLPEQVRDALESPGDGAMPGGLVDALNELVKDPELAERAGLEELDRDHRVGRRVWPRLADPKHASERDMIRCQRLLLESIYGNKLPEAKPAGDDSYEFRVAEFRDWKAAATALVEGSTKQADPKRRIWDRLDEPSQNALREAKAAGDLTPEAKEAVVGSLNTMLRTRPFLLEPDFQDYLRTKKPAKLIMDFLPGNQAWVEHDFHRGCRAYNRFLLDVLSPKGLGTSKRPEGPPRTVAYRSRGESIGEMSLVERTPRTATCVAYGHPEDDPEREVGPIQLVRIGRELFEELEAASPSFRRHLEKVVAERKAAAKPAPPKRGRAAGAGSVDRSGRSEELGLLQGQRLMLVDLERCTRCDECVRACVDTHDDGRSRLFLDGPRIGKYLVPTTCRSCLDPVCMIGCPVGSIHRGSNGEIIIEDWCIGCEACASQCPYGAIQMHKSGIIPESSFGWRFAPAATLPAEWYRGSHRDRDWHIGSAPFVFDREFRTMLGHPGNGQLATEGSVAFRYDFDVERDLLGPGSQFILSMTSMDEGLAAWLNGRPVVVPPPDAAESGIEVARRKSRDHGWWEIEAELPSSCLKRGRNSVAVRVTARQGGSDRLLDLRLDREEGSTVKLVEQKAVVCDLCSAQYGQRPACVTACPHDAAIRVNALLQLPTL